MIKRRDLMLSAGGALLLPNLVHAAGPGGSTGLAAIRQFNLGDMTISILGAGSFTMGLGMFGANVGKDAVGDLVSSYGLPRDKAQIPLQIMLIETEGQRVLVDAGMSGGRADLLAGLDLLGIAPKDIDTLFLSHGHPDHVGGLSQDGDRIFTSAEHFLPEVEFKFWTQDPEKAPVPLREMIRECREHILPVSHGLRAYEDGQEIAPGVFAIDAPGHTHGHSALRLVSGGQELLHLVDTSVHYIANLAQPSWTLGADLNKPLAVETRKRLLSQAAESGTLVAGYHFPFPGVGRILREGDGFRFHPVPLV